MNKRQIAWFTVGFLALVWVCLSLSCLGVSLAAAFDKDFVRLNAGAPVLLSGMGGLNVLLALGLLAAAWSGARGHPSRAWYPRRAWVGLGLLLLLVLILGALVPVTAHTSLLFAPVHAGLIILTALLLLFAAARAAGEAFVPTARQWLFTLSAGAFSAIPAIVLELMALVMVIVLFAMLLPFIPGGMEQLEAWGAQLQALRDSGLSPSPEMVAELGRSPWVLGAMALMFGAAAPLVEELSKTLVVAVLAWRERGASLTRAYLWGLACGAGFAMLEGIGNGGAGLGEGTWLDWASGIATRFPASAMHMLASGLIGLGWAYFWRGKRWALPLAYLGAMLFHGLWNVLAVAMIGSTFFITDVATPGLPLGLALLALGGLGMLVMVALLAAPLLPLWLRRVDAAALSQAETAPSSPMVSEIPADESGNDSGAVAL